MGDFLRTVAGVLVAVIICLTIQKQGKDLSLVLSLGVCVMVMAAAMGFLKPVLEFVGRLCELGNVDNSFVQIIFKAVGIGLVADIAETICVDSGNAALAKSVQFMAGAVILWLSLPAFTALIDLVQMILEGL